MVEMEQIVCERRCWVTRASTQDTRFAMPSAGESDAVDGRSHRTLVSAKQGSQKTITSGLIHRYQGNPLWLKSVATLIQELGVSVTELLVHDSILLPEDLKDILQQQCDRISEIEKQVMLLLAKESKPVNLAKLLENGIMPLSDILNALQSLSRRCLIEQQGNSYSLPPVLRQYIKG